MKIQPSTAFHTIGVFIAAIAGLAFGAAAIAAPTSVQVCTQVLDNADANSTEGGTWSYTVANQAISFQSPTTSRDESQSASPAACAASVALPAGSSSLSVLQSATSPANWLRNAPGYPQWIISDGTRSVSGSGVSALLSSASSTTFASFSGAVTVTFTNGSGRLVNRICKVLQDNGSAPSGQSGTFTLTAAGASTTLTAVEGAGPVCDNSFQANIPFGANGVVLGDNSPSGLASGFPIVAATGSSGGTANGALLAAPTTASPNLYSSSFSLGVTAGDVAITFTNKFAAPDRQVTLCKVLEDNADGIDQSGANTINYRLNGSVSVNVTEGAAAPACVVAANAPVTETSTVVRELALPGNFNGFAVGYPKWAIYGQSNLATPLLTGSGTVADIPWTNAALSGVQAVQVVFTDRAGAFGNGAQPNTGAVSRICGLLLDNGNASADSGMFALLSRWNDNAASLVSGATGTLTEGGGVSCPVTLARWSGDNSQFVSQAYQPLGGWSGNAPGYPKVQTYALQNPTVADAPLSSTQMAFNETVGLGASFDTSANLPATGDFSTVIVNKADTAPRTITFCLRVDDNGLAPTTDGGSWNFSYPALGGVSATEGSGSSCLTPYPLPDPNGSAWSSAYVQSVDVPSSWPGFDVYAGANPVAASPYVQFTTTTGGAGIQDASANFGFYGSQRMMWSGAQSFFQSFGGSITVTFVARPSARYQVCSDVLQNGDGNDDSNTFGINYTQGANTASASKTVAEGAAAQCVTAIVLPDAGVLSASETLSGTWNNANNTSGFPQWSIASNGPSPVNQTGSGLSTGTIPQNPAAQQGDTTITFNNRTGAIRYVTFCEQLIDNSDGNLDSGTFQISVVSNDPSTPNVGTYTLSASETSGVMCGPPVAVPLFATTLDAKTTLPFVSGSGYPKWAVQRSDGTAALSGSGLDTGNFSLNAVNTPNLSMIFQVQKSNDADISVTKSGPATVAAGTNISYQVIVHNAGPSDAPTVTVGDTPPPGLTLLGVSTPCASGFPCVLSNVAANASVTLTATYKVPSSYLSMGGVNPIANSATVSSSIADANTGNNTSAVVQTTVTSSADVSIAKTGPATAAAGGGLTYTLLISNAGPSSADGTTYSDSLPAGVTGAVASCGSASGGAVCANPASSGTIITGTIPTLPANGSVTITITATAPQTTGTIANTATATVPAGTTDSAPANNTSQAVQTAIFISSDLSISLDDHTTTYTPGSPIAYTIVVNNLGPSNASGFSISDAVPVAITGLTVSCSPTGSGNCGTNATSGNNVSFTGASLQAGVSNFLTITVSGTVAANATGNLTNSANVAAVAGTDPASSNNSATDVDAPSAQADLKVTIDDGGSGFAPGGPITYTIVVTDLGPSNASPANGTGFSISGSVPAAITGITITCTPAGTGDCGANASSGNSLSFTGASVATGAGNSLVILVHGTVASSYCSALTTSATVTPASGTDSNAGNNSASDTDSCKPAADLSISVNNGVDYLQGGSLVDYTIIVTNSGPSDAVGATVSDVLPSNLVNATWICQPSPNASCTARGAGDISDTVTMAKDTTLTYTLTGTVMKLPEMPMLETATVTVGGSQVDPIQSNNRASQTTTVGIFANGFDSNALGSAVPTPDWRSEGTDVLAISPQDIANAAVDAHPRVVATLADANTSTGVLLHVRRMGKVIEGRLSWRDDGQCWRSDSWLPISSGSGLFLGWSRSEDAHIDMLELQDETGTLDSREVIRDAPAQ